MAANPEFPHYYPDAELARIEQGERAIVYAKWPSVFPVALGSARYSMAMNMELVDLSNA
jgi:hypothetical protein